MKLSISLDDADVALVDALQAQGGFASRSAVIQHALATLRAQGLHAEYAAAWEDWDAEGEAGPWDTTTPDGVGPAKGTT